MPILVNLKMEADANFKPMIFALSTLEYNFVGMISKIIIFHWFIFFQESTVSQDSLNLYKIQYFQIV